MMDYDGDDGEIHVTTKIRQKTLYNKTVRIY